MILNTPLSEKDVRKLQLGDIVTLNGDIVTGRDKVHMRALNSKDAATKCLKNAAVFHCGPIIADNEVIVAGPTTSARMNAIAPEFIRKYTVRAVIGKGGMSREVLEAMKEVGCVYLAATGGAAVSLAESLTVTGVEWNDLGMAEAMWKMKAHNMGPLIVAMDSNGNSLYDDIEKSLKY